MRSKKKKYMKNFINIVIMIIFLIFTLYPFYSMILSSFKTKNELYNPKANPLWISSPTFENYIYLFTKTNYPRWYLNSIIVTLITTGISIFASIMAAYALARLEFFGVKTLGIGIFLVYLIPPTLLFIPLSKIITSLGISDTLWSLIFTYPTFQIPFSTWMLMGYFRNIPKEIEDSAMVDGASRMRILWTIIIPMSLPAIVTVTLFCFTLSWGEIIYALTFISDSSKQLLSVGSTIELIRGDMFYWGPLMAGGILAAIPIVLVFSLLLDYYIAGLAAGGIK